MIMIPHGDSLMISAPVHPTVDVVFGEGASASVTVGQNLAYVRLAQTSRLRFLIDWRELHMNFTAIRRSVHIRYTLNSSNDELAGSCCWKDFLSNDLAERTVMSAMASRAKVMCLCQAS